MSLFDRTHRYTRAREAQAAGLYPYFVPISASYDRSGPMQVKGGEFAGELPRPASFSPPGTKSSRPVSSDAGL